MVESVVEIRVLGPVDLLKDGTPTPIASTIQRTLLALLIAGRGEVVSTGHIFDAVWRDADRSDRRRIWFHVSKLRDLLGSSLQIEHRDDGYRLSVPEDSVDAWRFEQLVDSGIEELRDNAELGLETLCLALSLWRGNPYANVATDAIGWAETVRLDELRMTALEHSFEARLLLGMYEETVSALRILTTEYPYRERMRAQLMRALYATGRQVDALRAYADARHTLAQELGIEPSPALQDLEMQILRQDPNLAAMPLNTSQPDGTAASRAEDGERFVGRHIALATIDREVARFLAAERRVILIRGQAGIGKSALACEVARRVQTTDRRALVVEGRGRETSGRDDPLGAVRMLPRLLVGDLTTVGARRLSGEANIVRLRRSANIMADVLSERGAGVIGTLVSEGEVSNRLAGTGFNENRDLSHRGGTVADELVEMLVATALRVPLVVVVDDLHWADEASINALIRLVDEDAGRLLLIGTYRPEEVEGRPDHPLLPAINVVRRNGGVVIDLDEVAIVEAFDFIAELVDREPNALDDSFRGELTRASDGNPLFALEFMADLKERGHVEMTEPGWALASEPDWQIWPARVEGVLSVRIERASPRLMNLLRAASVEGEEFTADVIGSVHGMGVRDVIETLSREGAERHRLVEAMGPAQLGEGRVFRYRFRHHLFQRFIYDQLDDVERSHLHGKIADALVERVGQAQGDELSVAVGRHYQMAGLPAEAVRWLSTAAKRAIRLSANEAAIELILRAIDLTLGLTSSRARDAQEFELLLQLGTAYSVSAGFASDEVKEAFSRASHLARVSNSHLQQMQVFFGLFVYYASVGDYEQALVYEKRTAEVAEVSGDSGMRLQALHCAWPSALFRGEVELAMQKSSEALDLYRHDSHHPLTFAFGNHDAAVCALSLGGLARAIHGEGRGAVASVRQAIELAQTFDHRPSLMQALTMLAWVHHLNHDLENAGAAAEAVLDLRLGVPVWNSVARAVLAWVDGKSGSTGAAAGVLRKEFDLSFQLSRGWSQFTGTMLVEMLILDGRVEEARDLVGRLFRHVHEVGGFYVAEVVRMSGLVHYGCKEPEVGEHHLRRAIGIAREQASYLFAVRAAIDLRGVSESSTTVHAIAGDLPSEFDLSLLTG